MGMSDDLGGLHMDWAHYESPDDCSYVMDLWGERTVVGMAHTANGDPGVVLWQQDGDGWRGPTFLPARNIDYLVSAAMASSMAAHDWFAGMYGRGTPVGRYV